MTYDYKTPAMNSGTLRCHHVCMCEEMAMGQTEKPRALDKGFPVSAALNAIIHTR